MNQRRNHRLAICYHSYCNSWLGDDSWIDIWNNLEVNLRLGIATNGPLFPSDDFQVAHYEAVVKSNATKIPSSDLLTNLPV